MAHSMEWTSAISAMPGRWGPGLLWKPCTYGAALHPEAGGKCGGKVPLQHALMTSAPGTRVGHGLGESSTESGTAIKSAKNTKSTGIHGISVDLVRQGGFEFRPLNLQLAGTFTTGVFRLVRGKSASPPLKPQSARPQSAQYGLPSAQFPDCE